MLLFFSAAQTPIFQSPRLPVKRKVSVDEPDNLSPNSKHRKAAMESSFTPKVMRARSVSIKNRFKRKKSLDGNKFKEPSLIIHHPFDANALVKTPGLPDKPSISIMTTTPSKYFISTRYRKVFSYIRLKNYENTEPKISTQRRKFWAEFIFFLLFTSV